MVIEDNYACCKICRIVRNTKRRNYSLFFCHCDQFYKNIGTLTTTLNKLLLIMKLVQLGYYLHFI